MFGLRGGAVGVPRWILGFRIFQLILTFLIIALTAYGLSIYSGGPIRTPLIAMMVIAVLTVVPILVLVTPLHLAQRKIYDPRISLFLDLFALLFWLAAFTALASYLNIFKYYGRDEDTIFTVGVDECRKCRRSYESAIAATVFAALEFLLFFTTTLLFIYYYHHEMAGTRASGFGRRGNHTKAESAAVGTAAAGTHDRRTHGMTGNHEGEGHQMSSLFHGSTTTNGNHGTGRTGTHGTGLTGMHGTGMTGAHVNFGPQMAGQHTKLPYPGHGSQDVGRYGMNLSSNVV